MKQLLQSIKDNNSSPSSSSPSSIIGLIDDNEDDYYGNTKILSIHYLCKKKIILRGLKIFWSILFLSSNHHAHFLLLAQMVKTTLIIQKVDPTYINNK